MTAQARRHMIKKIYTAPGGMVAMSSNIDYLDSSWEDRKKHALGQASQWLDGFVQANAAYVHEMVLASAENARLHVVFNVGSDALRNFLETDDYKNVYEHPVVEGKPLRPSKKRQEIDGICQLAPPKDYYFCALSVGGTGMRFYGEYCVVLKSPDDAASVKRVLDRNSYDFMAPPLSDIFSRLDETAQQRLAASLMCDFRSPSLGDMLSIKVLQHHGARPRLLTIGLVGEAVLSDEDYVEAYHQGKIRLATVLEIRSHPEDEMTESSIEDRFVRGEPVSAEELQWAARRRQVRHVMDDKGIRHRVATGNGRGRRWR